MDLAAAASAAARTLQAKAERIRRAVDDALPSRLARRHGDRSRSLADLDRSVASTAGVVLF